jgi:hypothetical protein
MGSGLQCMGARQARTAADRLNARRTPAKAKASWHPLRDRKWPMRATTVPDSSTSATRRPLTGSHVCVETKLRLSIHKPRDGA